MLFSCLTRSPETRAWAPIVKIRAFTEKGQFTAFIMFFIGACNEPRQASHLIHVQHHVQRRTYVTDSCDRHQHCAARL
jgi:hypothetical protein